jgi:Rieske [2Fe-2S] domain
MCRSLRENSYSVSTLMIVLGLGVIAAPARATQWSTPVQPPAGCRSTPAGAPSLAVNASGAWVVAAYAQTGSGLEAFGVSTWRPCLVSLLDPSLVRMPLGLPWAARQPPWASVHPARAGHSPRAFWGLSFDTLSSWSTLFRSIGIMEVAIEDLAPGGMKVVQVEEREIVVGNDGGRFYAVERRCGHMNAPLVCQ